MNSETVSLLIFVKKIPVGQVYEFHYNVEYCYVQLKIQSCMELYQNVLLQIINLILVHE